jgi:ankyrin repeat protein
LQHHIKKRGRAALFEKEPGGWTALHKAARKGKAEMVEYLIENMASSSRD